MDSLLHIIGSLNMDLDEVTARFSDIPSVRKKNAFITRQMPELKMGIDLTQTANKQKFAKAIFEDPRHRISNEWQRQKYERRRPHLGTRHGSTFRFLDTTHGARTPH